MSSSERRDGSVSGTASAAGLAAQASVTGEANAAPTPTAAAEAKTHADKSHGQSPPHHDDHAHHDHPQNFWLWVMCLTGVDYFSTLGYQPYLAFEAAGLLAPLATFVLVLLTLFGALPVYAHVASKSPFGQGSIAMLEKLLYGWKGKALVLILLGFAATDYIITKTLSSADAAVHLIENKLWNERAPQWILDWGIDQERMTFTIVILILLGAMFLRGFKEVIGVAVGITAIFLLLNVVIILSGIFYLISHPELFNNWIGHVQAGEWEIDPAHIPISGTGIWSIIGISLLIFPKLALGLSGFETGVAVMPLIQGDPSDTPHHPTGRIRNTRKMLVLAAGIMSVLLISSSILTATLIDPRHMHKLSPAQVAQLTPDQLAALELNTPEKMAKAKIEGYRGPAVERAIAYLAHSEGGELRRLKIPFFGTVFGTIYDISTIAILAFAGASAMAGLLNLVPQYLPRYGMAPMWARATRPLVVIFTLINLLVTWIFNADVSKQGAAYATGVLVLMSSACLATLIDKWREHRHEGFWRLPWGYALITGVFFYTTAANMFERPSGLMIAGCFILAILLASFWSRLQRSTELRFQGFEFADPESKFMWESLKHLEFPVLVPHRPGGRDLAQKDANIRQRHRLVPDVPIVFIEAELGDPSEFQMNPLMSIREEEGRFVIGVQRCVSIAHVIAIIALECSKSGTPPEIHFGWSTESPLAASFSFLLFGEGNVPWMVNELIRKAELDPARQPQVFIG